MAPTSMHRIQMSHILIDAMPSQRRAAQIVGFFAIANGLFLLGTWGFEVFYWGLDTSWNDAAPVKHVLVQLSLAQENVLAVWYASMQLLAVSGFATLCFIADRQNLTQARILPYGWVVLAVAFAGLSLDELGSLHERVSLLGTAAHPWLGWTVLLALLAGGGGFAIVFALVHLRRSWPTLVLLVMGVALFASIPVQESIESAMKQLAEDPAAWQRPTAFVLLEEGAELAASLCTLAAVVFYAAFRRAGTSAVLGVRGAVFGAGVLVAALAVAMGAVELFVTYAPKGDTGLPRNWFASVLAVFVAGVGFHLWRTTRGAVYAAVALLSIATAAFVGANLFGYLAYLGVGPATLAMGGAAALVTVGIGGLLIRRAPHAWSKAGAAVWVALLASAVLARDPETLPVLVFGAYGALLPSLFLHYLGDRT